LNEAFTVEAIRAEISEHNNVFVLALVNNEPIGYLKLVSNESRGYIEVDKLYLFKKYQGRGVGRQLMTFAEETAKKKKMWTITLVVWEKNISALEFYQYHGYTIEGKTERNKGGEIQIGLRLRKTLKKVSD
jgi:diamine N-acetyltransferase